MLVEELPDVICLVVDLLEPDGEIVVVEAFVHPFWVASYTCAVNIGQIFAKYTSMSLTYHRA